MSGAKFVRFYPSDWRSGCIGLTLEQEGFYIRVCAFISDTGQRLPADDDRAAAKLMGLHTNAYRKVRDQLIAIGKIVERSGMWTVPRADKELALATANQGRGQERPFDAGTERDTAADTVGDTPLDTTLDTPLDTVPVFSKNANKINDAPRTSYNQYPVDYKRREEGYADPPDSSAAREDRSDGRTPAYGDLKKAFNGSTEAMLVFVERAMGGRCRPNAEQWLSSTVAAYGQTAVAQAFAVLVEKQAAGEISSRPLPHWSSIARGMKDRATSRRPRVEPAADKPSLSEIFRRKREAEASA